MTPVEALFYTIAAIALAAIAISFHLLDQRRKLRRDVAWLENRVEHQDKSIQELRDIHLARANEELHLMRLREQAIIRHAEKLIEERNLLRAQLVACTEAPRFPVVTRGSC